MALCGKCGASEKIVGKDDNGNCGNCNGDYWVEWQDFMDDELEDYLDIATKTLHVSMSKLAADVYESSFRYMRLSKEERKKRFLMDVFNKFVV